MTLLFRKRRRRTAWIFWKVILELTHPSSVSRKNLGKTDWKIVKISWNQYFSIYNPPRHVSCFHELFVKWRWIPCYSIPIFAKIPWNQHSTNLYFIVTLFSRNFFLIGGKFRKKKEPWHKFCHFHTNSCKMLQSCNRFVIYNTILTWVCFLGIFRLRL